MAEPPVLDGAVKATLNWPLPAVIPVMVGAPGVVTGVDEEAVVAVPTPFAFRARICTL